jgi:hypothetical protein
MARPRKDENQSPVIKNDTPQATSVAHTLHEAFEAHDHVTKVWVNEATGEWHLVPRKGHKLIQRPTK